MKNVLKFICSVICYTLFIPCILALSFCASWYLLPSMQMTSLGVLLLDTLGEQTIFIISLCSIVASIFFGIMGKIFTIVKSSKANNFYTHLITWMLALVLVAESGYAFATSGDLQTVAIDLTLVRKIGILTCAAAMLLYAIIAPKVRKIVDRKIQAYDTAKELNAEGRSSIVGMQILKCLDFICPEIFLLIALCFAFNWEISLYFIFIICAFVMPILGNIVCDKRVRKEAKRNKQEERDTLVNEVANAVTQQMSSTTP